MLMWTMWKYCRLMWWNNQWRNTTLQFIVFNNYIFPFQSFPSSVQWQSRYCSAHTADFAKSVSRSGFSYPLCQDLGIDWFLHSRWNEISNLQFQMFAMTPSLAKQSPTHCAHGESTSNRHEITRHSHQTGVL